MDSSSRGRLGFSGDNMRLLEAKQKIQGLRIPLLQTHEVAKILDLSNSQASLILHRLQEANEIVSIKKGLWLLEKDTNAFSIGEYLARPYPAYISLQSALYLHGMVSQIPTTIFLVTLARSQKKKVRDTTYSFHHMTVPLFLGFEYHENFNLACPEKALFDFYYFSATKKNIFKALPELEIPRGFNKNKLRDWCGLIANPRLRSHVAGKIK